MLLPAFTLAFRGAEEEFAAARAAALPPVRADVQACEAPPPRAHLLHPDVLLWIGFVEMSARHVDCELPHIWERTLNYMV